MPVYKKMGDPDVWLEMVKTTDYTWRWYIKPTKERGPDNSVCYGYGSSCDVVLPQDCDSGKWYVHDGAKFVKESSVTCELITPHSVSEFLQELVVTQRIVFEEEIRERDMLVMSDLYERMFVQRYMTLTCAVVCIFYYFLVERAPFTWISHNFRCNS